jgi:hypothetical protein
MRVSNYMYDKYNERGMKAFEKRVKNFLSIQFKDQSISAKEVICHNAYMERGNGYGSYYKVIEIEIDGIDFKVISHTNDSETWDNWYNPTSKDKRQMFEAVIEMEIESLVEQINNRNHGDSIRSIPTISTNCRAEWTY